MALSIDDGYMLGLRRRFREVEAWLRDNQEHEQAPQARETLKHLAREIDRLMKRGR